MAVLATGCGGSSKPTPTSSSIPPFSLSAVVCPPGPANHTAVANPPRHFSHPPRQVIAPSKGYCAYVMTTAGLISVRLRPEFAPNTVNNFVYLAEQGFYDGLSFYRVCPDASDPACPAQAPIAVAGDPTGTGSGGPGYTLPAEPVVGQYLLGAVAMYSSDPKSIGSQFFLSKGDGRSLPRTYVLFGQVTDGIVPLVALKKANTILWIDIEPTSP